MDLDYLFPFILSAIKTELIPFYIWLNGYVIIQLDSIETMLSLSRHIMTDNHKNCGSRKAFQPFNFRNNTNAGAL